jgi:HK97 family phage prohead protease
MTTYKRGDTILCGASALAHKLASEPDGFVSGIASSPTVDAMGHIVMPHAFDASIRTKGLRGPGGIKLLAGHDPEKIAGIITRLETVGSDLQLDALLNLNISYARDLYEAAKQIGGLSFSVGFRLEEFELVEAKNSKRGEILVVKSGDLLEVSIVSFPACGQATMTHVKNAPQTGNSPMLNACMAQVSRIKELLSHGR